jgi:hypothetical protein
VFVDGERGAARVEGVDVDAVDLIGALRSYEDTDDAASAAVGAVALP